MFLDIYLYHNHHYYSSSLRFIVRSCLLMIFLQLFIHLIDSFICRIFVLFLFSVYFVTEFFFLILLYFFQVTDSLIYLVCTLKLGFFCKFLIQFHICFLQSSISSLYILKNRTLQSFLAFHYHSIFVFGHCKNDLLAVVIA